MAHTTRELNEIRMYGCTVNAMRESIEDSITFKLSGPAMIAMSLLSDAQEWVSTEHGEVTPCAAENARQTINRAKWVLMSYLEEQKFIPATAAQGV